MNTKKAAVISLGCAKNLVDSEVMLGYLKRASYTFVGKPEDADVIIINTCGFIQPARDEAEEIIENVVRLKKKERNKVIAVVGCYVERYRESLEKRFADVDIWMGVRDFDRIVGALQEGPPRASARTFLYSHDSPRLVTTPGSWAYVKISEGCSHHCSFCSIPLIKGPYRSRALRSIVGEVRALGKLGVKEINLISHDTTFYGRERRRKTGLVTLLERLIVVRDIRWIRLLYGYPEEVSMPLLDLMTDDKICAYLDIPFQHSVAGLVKSMKRGLDGVKALRLIEKIRRKVPGIALRTSLIVGFPGEGRKEFENLKSFVREAHFDHLGVFVYSPEEGTASWRMPDTVSRDEKEKRRRDIMAIQAECSAARNKSYIGRTLDVLLEGPRRDNRPGFVGRSTFQAPEVDGVIYIDGSLPASEGRIPPLAKVEITGAEIYDLRGRFV